VEVRRRDLSVKLVKRKKLVQSEFYGTFSLEDAGKDILLVESCCIRHLEIPRCVTWSIDYANIEIDRDLEMDMRF
jgi:hypothetical protein